MKSPTIVITAAVAALACACGGASEGVESSRPAVESSPPAAVEPAPLTFDVFTSGEAGFHATSTLIMGERDAVLIDAQFNLSSARQLAAWVGDKGVELAAIVVSHAHPDHYFGLEAVLEAFPGTPVYTTADVIDHMKELGPAKLAYWGPIYGDDLTTSPLLPAPLDGSSLDLEGRAIELIAVHGDAHPQNAIHVPSIDLIVAADLAYSDVHPWLADVPTADGRAKWMASLDRIAALDPSTVVPGHSGPGGITTPAVLADTRAYIAAFDRLRGETSSPAELQAAMLELYPGLALPVILELAAGAAF